MDTTSRGSFASVVQVSSIDLEWAVGEDLSS